MRAYLACWRGVRSDGQARPFARVEALPKPAWTVPLGAGWGTCAVAEGRVDILIGTHRLLSKDVVFKDLGLLIIDEEQRFGVAAKERLTCAAASTA